MNYGPLAGYPFRHRLPEADIRNAVSARASGSFGKGGCRLCLRCQPLGNCNQTQVGQAEIEVPLERMPNSLEASGLTILPIAIAHVLTVAEPQPPTRDPFDRLLLAQAQVEGLQLVTIDRALIDHPLAYRF